MTRSKRVIEVLFGIVMFLAGAAFFMSGTEASVTVMLLFLQLGMTVRGLSALYYYLSMARYMVGGKTVLFRSLAFLDLGVLAGSLIGHSMIFAAVYLASVHAFDGVVSIFRANESRVNGAQWKLKMTYGVTDILIAVAVILGNAVFKEPVITTYIYGAGLMYAAVLRIVSAFRRTKIVYIQ